ncbi:putative L10-interacting MYB domain-containing protein [Iris pallida]|uniref:L10-interacting MYB domain-containing protein n=1 Tax=Iris pallida TaxID=29817 RepID=A0AAX6DU31_IRIPA|nr:putative L10-interacting MYB domain-containing protein [Iris pallida]KAJ6833339.1 putative L10-interacting MYB domain-containing protein [Iris pallida]
MDNEKEPANWGDNLVQVFCDLCIKNIEAGNRPSTHFSSEGWASMVEEFSKLTGKLYTKVQLKNKWDALKGDWKLWKQLKGKETDRPWDPVKKTIQASSEWWAKRLESLPSKAKKFRKKGIPPEFEATLDRMYMRTVAVEELTWTTASGEQQESYNSPMDDVNIIVSGDDSSEDIKANNNNNNNSVAAEKSTTTMDKTPTTPSYVKKRVKKRKEIDGVEKLSQQIDRLCEAVESRGSSTSKRPNTAASGITCVMEQLDALSDVQADCGLYLFATRLFMSSEKREMFTAIKKQELKIAWLKNEHTKQPDL